MTEQNILDSAPKGATHYDEVYLKQRANTTWMYWDLSYGWNMLKKSGINHYENLRSLSDIRKIVEQQARIDELEKVCDSMLHEVANQYDGDDLTEWSIGANHVFKLFAKWVFNKRAKALKAKK
jgi:hypothetical protein